MPTDRCGHASHPSRYPDYGAVTCWRPTFEEHDRCIWHAEVAVKPPQAFEALEPQAGERLDGAVLGGVSLADRGLLRAAVLIGAGFEKANLNGADLKGADLRDVDFTDTHAKGTSFEGAKLEDATFDGTKLEAASFRDAQLKDAEFSRSRISRKTRFDDVVVYEKKFRESDDADIQEQFDAATWVYRKIQGLSRRNALFRNAERYYYREKDLRRRFAWRRRNYLDAVQTEGARWLMGYGRNPWRIIAASGIVIVACALLFPFLGALRDTAMPEPATYALAFPPEAPIDRVLVAFEKSLYFSVVTFGTLGFGDIEPVGTAARALAGIETLVGFGLIALLISVLLRRGNWL